MEESSLGLPLGFSDILDMPRVGFRTITFVMRPRVVGTSSTILHPFSGSTAYEEFRSNLEFY